MLTDTVPLTGVISLNNITKAFPGVVANDDISLDLVSGQVHCLLGENGAGKSTLISILAGMQLPDSGTITIDGETVSIGSPKIAMRHGIGVVHQHSTLVPSLTVIENLMLGETGLLLKEKEARSRLDELSALLGISIDPRTLASDLGLGQQQQVEIAKAMWKGSRLLILDEPTSMLTPSAIENLAESIGRLTERGLGVVFITHKLREAYSMGDCVTVLRSGKKVGFLSPERMKELDEDQAQAEILRAMFGEDLRKAGTLDEAADLAGATEATREVAQVDLSARPVVIELDDVTSSGRTTDVMVKDVSLRIRSGEIFGIAGIDGHGQTGLAEVVAGQRAAVQGAVRLEGEDITRTGVRDRQELGVRYVTDDRLHEGTVCDLSVALNFVLKRIGKAPFWRFGQINRSAVNTEAKRLIDEYSIRTPSPSTRAAALSGGNIQKILLARELAPGAKVVVVNKPTYGLDLKTVRLVHDLLREFAAGGGAVLLISTELDELVELSHRIGVISKGEIVGVVDNDGVNTAEKVGQYMIGGTHAGD
ncbi:ABC transporter ATP-binding protein [Leifsonia shinshuensis]|uniref:putative B6 ABC transporter ATP-binding protein n=1 Tax=Leifsonia shinshuensis TaxID=150026 RepID=UPI001F510A97|nr:ABC transporter ATP-binding protein [Leifsonia shinshuensis]MCI0156470.1 ABC transporter ATP-binding protein [Leifsonia shinshuensis]